MTLPPLPEPDTHCFDDDTGLDVWSHSPDQMHAYGEACAVAERGLVAEPQAEPVRECADNDSPWLICKPCAAVGRCAKLPVAWRSKERINGEFDSGWKLTSNEPPQTPRTIAIEPLYTHPPQQRQPLPSVVLVGLWGPRSDGPDNHEIVSFARLVERAHGIGETA